MVSSGSGHFGPLKFLAVKLMGHHTNSGSVKHCISYAKGANLTNL